MPQTQLVHKLSNHPRLIGALFAATFLLAHALPVLAGNGGGSCPTCAGP